MRYKSAEINEYVNAIGIRDEKGTSNKVYDTVMAWSPSQNSFAQNARSLVWDAMFSKTSIFPARSMLSISYLSNLRFFIALASISRFAYRNDNLIVSIIKHKNNRGLKYGFCYLFIGYSYISRSLFAAFFKYLILHALYSIVLSF